MVYLEQVLIFAGLFVVSGAPVAIVAWRHGRNDTVKKFLLTAVGLTLVCAVITTTSQSLEARCLAAGNPTCNDYGSTGLVFLIVGVYAAVAMVKAIQIVRH